MYTYTHLEDYTQKVFEKINIYIPDELNLSPVARLLNIHVNFIDAENQSVRSSGCHYIFLNRALNPFEHLDINSDTSILHTGNQQHTQTDYRMYQEWKANLFALHFCLPTFIMLHQLPSQHLNEFAISETFGITREFACKRLKLYHQMLLHYQIPKPKKHYLKNEPEVFWYLNAEGEKLWSFRHRYYDAPAHQRKKPKQGLASEKIAIRELLKVKTDLINGNVKKVDHSNLTISEWMDIWLTKTKDFGQSQRGRIESEL